MVDRFGCPVVVNIWNSKHIVNKNAVVFGPSRSGKSVGLNHLTTQFLHYVSTKIYESAHHVIIIDIGGSYKKNAAINGGFYFDANIKKELTFNVFLCPQDREGNYLYNATDEDGEGADDRINFVYTVIRKLWRGTEKITIDEKNVVKDCLRQFYEYVNAKKIFPDITSFHDFLTVYEEDKIKPEYKGFVNFVSLKLALHPFVFGEHKYLLNAKENLNLRDKSFIVFDLQGVLANEEIAGIVTIVVVGITADKIEYTKGVRKTVIIDEAIDFLKGDSGDFIGGYYRKIAKRGGQVILATQGVGYLEDIDPLTKKSIFGNSDIKILLNHRTDRQSYPALRRNLGLTDHDIDLLDSLENGPRYREIFIKLGDYAKVYRTEVGYFTEGVYSSSSTELEEIYTLEKEIGNLGAAINQFVFNKYHKLNQN